MSPAAGERTPLNGSLSAPPLRTRSRAFLFKVGAALLVVALVALFLSSRAINPSQPTLSPTFSNTDWFCGEPGIETDFIQLANKKNAHYFYWFAPSRNSANSHDPVVLWLNGGPGASSLEGLLTENGPCIVQQDLSTQRNAFAWNNRANVIWLEQPVGVGFSYYTDNTDQDATGEDVGANMLAFLDGFFLKHPHLADRPFFLTGESYAGHYIPAAAYAIAQRNKKVSNRQVGNQPTDKIINLQGIAIGNGDPNLPLQYKYAVSMATDNAFNLTLLNQTQIQQMKQDADSCATQLATCRPNTEGSKSCQNAAEFCDVTQLSPYLSARRNFYDIRKPCASQEDCSDTDGGVLQRFLRSDTVKQALFDTVKGREWNAQVGYVYPAYVHSGDWARSYMRELESLLDDGLRMLIFAGDADLVCNWIGNKAWTMAAAWKGREGFNAAQDRAFVVDGVNAGQARSHENLSFLRVFNAGHLVPKDQPQVAFAMLERFVNNQPL